MTQLILWLLLAAIHALPAAAFFRPSGLTELYGLEPDNPLFLLMQHRAALFLGVFSACVFAAFLPEGRRLASVIVGISLLGFLFLFWRGGYPVELRTIAIVDIVGLAIWLGVTVSAYRA
ncbi:MAG: hypothetical protein MK010_03160 [Erythrobacter sp.]|nr:hypothetical protein [Erythrobacter sp.]